MSWFHDHAVLFALICATLAVAYGIGLAVWVLGRPAGNERMQEIARAIQEGAAAYLKRQYRTIAIVAIVTVPPARASTTSSAGGRPSASSSARRCRPRPGFIGMFVAVRSNVRTAEAAKHGLRPALNVAFRAGSVTGLFVVGLGLLGVAGYYWVLTDWLGNSPGSAIDDLVGLAFGGSLISVFARLGGGIYTKAADVGADLVGKIEAGIPEDDPRNPAVIADNVGDNVGDCAGMAADLFETYAVTAVAVMLLASTTFPAAQVELYPLAIGGMSILASIIGTMFARVGRSGNIMNALYKAVLVATILSAIGFIPVTLGLRLEPVQLLGSLHLGAGRPRRDLPAGRDHRVLHGHALEPGEVDREGLTYRPRDQHHRGARGRDAGDGPAGGRDRRRDPGREPLRRACTGSASQSWPSSP